MVYEVRRMTKLLLDENHETIRKGLEVTRDVIGTIEAMRAEAGIVFPGE